MSLTKYDTINYEDLEDLNFLSKGNFGQIFRATYFGTDVAVKQLLDVGNKRMHKYIEREMSLLMGLRHPHIVQFMGLCKHERNLFIVTEFVEGGDLYDKLHDKNIHMSWKLRVRIAYQVCLAVCYLHSRGIIHRDLKSQNLLVDKNWKIKICDFGFARATDPKEFMTMCGTDEWMAPEVVLGDKYNKSADIFSVGTIMAELITRRHPPLREPGNAYAFDVENLKKCAPDACPKELLNACMECVKFYPEERGDMKDIMKRLKQLEESLDEEDSSVSTNLSEDLTYMKIEGMDDDEEEEEAPKKRRKKKKKKTTENEDGTTTERKKKKKKRRTENEDGTPVERKKKKKKKKTEEE